MQCTAIQEPQNGTAGKVSGCLDFLGSFTVIRAKDISVQYENNLPQVTDLLHHECSNLRYLPERFALTAVSWAGRCVFSLRFWSR